ncbi:hypothetical protein JSY17_05265 [Pseudomonas capsici]|uniref:hypothetical protein n=1 Tax=Pseudomonas capsici TaxID=2810614 RepID=UPI0019101B38|nr:MULTISPECIES: hypothetical protein [Pseudomonas]MBN6713397.1 hypothetical protein [Pseudomonas capsici]MBN6718551.1 hypothetical protein [Pseudomonas capsici]MBN6724963.1 hypothetical protein [Pseudomonas capsici]GFM49628.1 hypothetical protein PSCICE_08950 [Pseudomonas cichorii]
MDFTWISELLSKNTTVLQASLISVIASAFISYAFRVREHKKKLAAEYNHEQRKALREIIGRSHGRLLHAGNSLSYRLWNLYANHDKGWLVVDNIGHPENYYLNSFVCRFLSVFSLVRDFERQALYVDARIASKKDRIFVKYVAALHWCMTDTELFSGIPYDTFNAVDHFFSDTLRDYCEICIDENGTTLRANAMLELGEKIHPVFAFFQGLSPTENRLRWDRLVSLHLLVATFINSIGYPEHRTSCERLSKIAKQIRNKAVLANMATWLPRHGLGKDSDSKKLISICKITYNKL